MLKQVRMLNNPSLKSLVICTLGLNQSNPHLSSLLRHLNSKIGRLNPKCNMALRTKRTKNLWNNHRSTNRWYLWMSKSARMKKNQRSKRSKSTPKMLRNLKTPTITKVAAWNDIFFNFNHIFVMLCIFSFSFL